MNQLKRISALPENIVKTLYACSKTIDFKTGDLVIKEKEEGDSFFIIEEGEIEVLKDDVQVGVIRKGDVLGESALNGGIHNASAKAASPAKLIKVSVKALTEMLSSEQLLQIKYAIFEGILDKLSKVNKLTTFAVRQHFEDEKAKAHMSRFIICVLILVFLYVFAIQSVTILKLNIFSSSVISVPILIICCITMFIMMKQSGYSLRTYGLNLENWKKSLVDSILLTIPVIVALILIKWALIKIFPIFSDLPLFDLSPALNKGAPPVSTGVSFFLVFVYSLFVPVQEIIYRGAMQSSLQLFITGRNKVTLAILVSNIPFSMIHAHLSLLLVITTYILGVYWGYMYARQKTLVGVCVSHFLVGLFAFFILGLEGVLIF